MRGQTCFALFEDNRTILVFFIVAQRDGRIEGYAPVARSLFPRARQLLEEISRGDRSVSGIRRFAVALRSSLFVLVLYGTRMPFRKCLLV